MQPMTFHPVVGDIGGQLVQVGIDALESGSHASTSLTTLVPAGSDEVSAQAVMAFHQDAAAVLNLHQAAQQELMRTGSALTQIAQTYTDADRTAADAVAFAALPMSNPWSGI